MWSEMGKIGHSMETIDEQVRETDTELKNIEENLEQQRLRLNVIRQQAQEYSTDSKIVNQVKEKKPLTQRHFLTSSNFL